jgi:hypothetical protein
VVTRTVVAVTGSTDRDGRVEPRGAGRPGLTATPPVAAVTATWAPVAETLASVSGAGWP